MNSDTNTAHHSDWPTNILAVTFFLLPALGVPHEYMLQDTLKSAIASFGILAAALATLWAVRNECGALRVHWIILLPLTLVVYALTSMVWSHAYLGAVEAIRWFLAATLLWTILNIRDSKGLRHIVAGIHLGASVASMWAVFQFWAGLDWFPQVAPPASTFANRNFFAEYAASVWPLSIWLLLQVRSRRLAIALGLSMALNLTAVMMTGARSAMVALLLTLPFISILLFRHLQEFRKRPTGLQHLVLGISFLIPTFFLLMSVPTVNPQFATAARPVSPLEFALGRASTLVTEHTYTQGSFATRTLMWRSSLRMLQDYPWSGVGAGAWEVQVPRYQGAVSSVEVDYYAHNDWLQLVSEYGLPLGIGWIAVLLAFVLLSYRTAVESGAPPADVAVSRGLAACSLLSVITVACAGFPLHLAGVVCVAMVALGIVTATLGPNDVQLGAGAATLKPRHHHAFVGVLFYAFCICLAAYVTVLAARAEYALVKAVNLANGYLKDRNSDRRDMERAAALLREGLAINPHYRKIGSPAADALVAFGDLPTAATALATIAQSRPHVADLWANLVMIHANLRQDKQAEVAMKELERLQPGASRTVRLRILLLYRGGSVESALQQLRQALDRGDGDIEIYNFGYAMGIESRDVSLALLALSKRAERWPTTAADGYFKTGMIYDTLAPKDAARARMAFELGYRVSSPEFREAFRQAVPSQYRQGLE